KATNLQITRNSIASARPLLRGRQQFRSRTRAKRPTMCVPKVQRSTLIEGNADPCRARYRIPRVYVADPHGGDEGVDGLAQVERITKRPKQHDWVARHDSGNARRDTVEARTGRGLARAAQFIAPDCEWV